MTAATKEAQDRVLAAALRLTASERSLADPRSHFSVAAFRRLEDELAIACRDLTRAVDAQPMDQRPKGWTETAA